MLSMHPMQRLADAVYLRISGGDPIRADELRASVTSRFQGFVTITYIPALIALALLAANRPQPVNETAAIDQMDRVKAFAVDCIDTYLKNASTDPRMKRCYSGDVPATELPAGGRAVIASSALPSVAKDGFQTYSVIVEAEIPKAANSPAMDHLRMQVDVASDLRNNLRIFTLPRVRPERAAGEPVELVTQTQITEDRPIYQTAAGFLRALLLGDGNLDPYIAASSDLTPIKGDRFTGLEIEYMQASAEIANTQEIPTKAAEVEVNIRANVQLPSGVQLPMDYPLVMSVAAGHWQVDRLNDSPDIAMTGKDDTETAADTTSPSQHSKIKGN